MDVIAAPDWQPNLSWLTPTLAVGGSFPSERIEFLTRHHAIRAVIDLRVEACDDSAELHRHGAASLHLPTEDYCAVSQQMLSEGVRFALAHLDRNERVLIHCEHGIGRSPLLALCVLVACGRTPLDALSLAKDRRAVISPSLAQYEAWAVWLEQRRTSYGSSWQVPDFDTFARIAYRHLASRR